MEYMHQGQFTLSRGTSCVGAITVYPRSRGVDVWAGGGMRADDGRTTLARATVHVGTRNGGRTRQAR